MTEKEKIDRTNSIFHELVSLWGQNVSLCIHRVESDVILNHPTLKESAEWTCSTEGCDNEEGNHVGCSSRYLVAHYTGGRESGYSRIAYFGDRQ